MKTRVVLVIALWAALAVGALTLFENAAVPVGVATLAAAAAFTIRTVVRRFRPHDARRIEAGEPAFPPGPRRVLLADTGLTLTHPRSRPRA